VTAHHAISKRQRYDADAGQPVAPHHTDAMTPDDWDDGYPDPDDPRWYPPADDDEPGIEALTAAERNPSLIRQ
jgi:hypothetical protein